MYYFEFCHPQTPDFLVGKKSRNLEIPYDVIMYPVFPYIPCIDLNMCVFENHRKWVYFILLNEFQFQ